MGDHDDKRKFPRAKVDLSIAVASGENQALELADIEDLTVEGISFVSDHNIPDGSDIYVIFASGDEMGENEVAGEVIRCLALSGDLAGKYRVTVRFIEMNDTFLMDVLALIHKDVDRSKKKD